MTNPARQEILASLRRCSSKEVSPRPSVPVLRETALDREGMISLFTEQLTLQTGEVHRVADSESALDRLTEIAHSRGLTGVITSTDDIIASFDLSSWGILAGVTVRTARDFPDRTSWKQAVFEEADAGITGADFAVAESGTVVLVHKDNQPRLVSLAPIFHIIILPVNRLVPTFEDAAKELFVEGEAIPAQVTFITGPSMTADIQARPFKGMHGPRKVAVLLMG